MLIVDDTFSNIVVLREILSAYRLGYEAENEKPLIITIEEAYCGDSAKELCRAKRFDLIFMDEQMPNVNGF